MGRRFAMAAMGDRLGGRRAEHGRPGPGHRHALRRVHQERGWIVDGDARCPRQRHGAEAGSPARQRTSSRRGNSERGFCDAARAAVPLGFGRGPGTGAAPESAPKVELSRYADAKGNIDFQKLTCGQLASAPPQDADVLGALYIGWHNGLAKKNAINVMRIKDVIRDLAVHCRANKDQRVAQAIESSGTDKRASSAPRAGGMTFSGRRRPQWGHGTS